MIELKYLKKSEAAEGVIERAQQEAYRQIQNYLRLEEFSEDGRVKGVIYVVAKDKIRYFEKIISSDQAASKEKDYCEASDQ